MPAAQNLALAQHHKAFLQYILSGKLRCLLLITYYGLVYYSDEQIMTVLQLSKPTHCFKILDSVKVSSLSVKAVNYAQNIFVRLGFAVIFFL